MDIVCKHCSNTFSSKQHAKEHLLTSKYCAVLRGEIANTKVCTDCKKEFTTPSSLKRHRKFCLASALAKMELLKIDLDVSRTNAETLAIENANLKTELELYRLIVEDELS